MHWVARVKSEVVWISLLTPHPRPTLNVTWPAVTQYMKGPRNRGKQYNFLQLEGILSEQVKKSGIITSCVTDKLYI